MAPVVVTGAAGFIGYHVANMLLGRGEEVVGLDNFNDYYDPALKEARAALLGQHEGFEMVRGDLVDRAAVARAFARRPSRVIHLAAQAGVRHSLDNPGIYVESNVVGFLAVLEACRQFACEHLVYASSSSVYGANRTLPFAATDQVDRPISLYGATKKANELMAHSYSHLYGIPTTGLRFFTAYGPWGRPDMAPILFAQAIVRGRALQVFSQGSVARDFTFISDIAEGVLTAMDHPPSRGAADHGEQDSAPYRVYNLGNGSPVPVLDFIHALETALDKRAILSMLPSQPGDVAVTWADMAPMETDLGFVPSVPLDVGVERFVEWYRSYYPTDASTVSALLTAP